MRHLIEQYPLIDTLTKLKETNWFNPSVTTTEIALPYVGLDKSDVDDASSRLNRFAPFLAHVFPQTKASKGIIESPICEISSMKSALETEYDTKIAGQLLLKMDSQLPISGSIKARGGIYEVLTLSLIHI